MKISKVDNVRLGTFRKDRKSNNIGGVLYYSPSKKDKFGEKVIENDLRKHIQRRQSSSEKLYQIFNPFEQQKDIIFNSIKDSLIRFCRDYNNNRSYCTDAAECLNKLVLSDYYVSGCIGNKTALAHEFIDLYISDKLAEKLNKDDNEASDNKTKLVRLILAICLFGKVRMDIYYSEDTVIDGAVKMLNNTKIDSKEWFDQNKYSIWAGKVRRVTDAILKNSKLYNKSFYEKVDIQLTVINNLVMTKSAFYGRKTKGQERIDKVTIDDSEFSIKNYAGENQILNWTKKYIRNSLRKDTKHCSYEKFVGVVASVLSAIFDKDAEKNIPEDTIKTFLYVINNDYSKGYQINSLVKSIEKQTVKIQYKEINGEHLLVFSNAENERRKYLSKWMAKYAGKDECGRKDMLCELKQYVIKLVALENRKIKPEYLYSKEYVNDDSNILGLEEKVREITLSEKRKDKLSLSKDLTIVIKNKIKSLMNSVNIMGELEGEERFWIYKSQEILIEMLTQVNDYSNKEYMFEKSFLCDEIFKRLKIYITSKFIDYGKAVFHFTNVYDDPKEGILGEVKEEYRCGIDGFDYELIKADETVVRDISQYIVSASNNFSRSVVPHTNFKDSDILMARDKELVINDSESLKRDILRFFGGKSVVESSIKNVTDEISRSLYEEFKICIQTLRNETYHYNGKFDEELNGDMNWVKTLFNYEYKSLSSTFLKKYYSNEVLSFYKPNEICRLINHLYKKGGNRDAQIPSFKTILPKTRLEEFLKATEIRYDRIPSDKKENFEKCIYYILKEIYYHDFVMRPDMKRRFKQAFDNYSIAVNKRYENFLDYKNRDKDIINIKRALDNFIRRIEVPMARNDVSFGQLCQSLITEFNLQNDGMKVKSSSDQKDIFMHYKEILKECIRLAFKDLLKEDNYAFIKNYVFMSDVISLEEFCKREVNIELYSELNIENPITLVWYACAHFMRPTELNHLVGSMRNYIQFVSDIERRKNLVMGTNLDMSSERIMKYNKVIPILEFVQNFVGKTSNYIFDYFGVDYKDILSKFVEEDVFNNKECAYKDDKNYILNRNIAFASMYSDLPLYAECMEKITLKEIKSTCELADKLQKYSELKRSNNVDIKRKEKQLFGQITAIEANRKYQNAVNRKELTDISIYSDIVNEFLGQFISWSYLRERDLMYFQFGFHYMRIFFNNIDNNAKYNCIIGNSKKNGTGDNYNISKGGILHNILAMNTHDVKMLPINDEGKIQFGKSELPNNVSNGKKYEYFIKRCATSNDYAAGFELFEDLETKWTLKDVVGKEIIENNKENKFKVVQKDFHEMCVDIRNYVDHGYYSYAHSKSIIDILSGMYGMFLSYNVNLKKSVLYVMQNILLRSFVTSNIVDISSQYFEDFKYGASCVINENTGYNKLMAPKFEIKLGTDKLTFKDGKKEKKVDARSDIFLNQLEKILRYAKK